MVKQLHRLSVAHAMMLLCACGVAAVLVYSGTRIIADLRHASALRVDADLTTLAVRVGNLTHALQKERGASTGFIATAGTQFGGALSQLRTDSDASIAAMRLAMTTVGNKHLENAALRDGFFALERQMARLGELRGRVNELTVDREAVLETYTQLNRDAIGLLPKAVRNITDADAAQAVQRHAVLMTAKDIAGLERAIGSAGFGRAQTTGGPFPRALYARFEALISQENALLATYQSIASAELSRALEAVSISEASRALATLRNTVRSFDGRAISSVSPETWFAAATAHIDELKVVEDQGAGEIAQKMAAAQAMVQQEISAGFAELGTVLVVLVTFSVFLVRVTSASLARAHSQVQRLAQGDIDAPINQAPQSDLRAITAALESYRQVAVDRRTQAAEHKRLEDAAAEGIRRVALRVSEGEFSDRLVIKGLTGPTLVLGNGINEILEEAETAVAEQRARDQQELQRREKEAEAQARAIKEMQRVVQECSNGQFQSRMQLEGLYGAWLEVATGINRIAERTDGALSDFRGTMSALEAGNLGHRLRGPYSGTFADIADATNASLDQLETAFANIRLGVHSVGAAAAELRSGTGDLAKRSEEQAQAVYESAAVTEDLARSVSANAERLTDCREMVETVVSKTANGQDISGRAVRSIEAIEEASEKMVKIVGTIDEIAFQTSLLALNASVEAARAGEAGRGFGVVASEVRALAARCAASSQQISALIRDAVEGVKQGAEHVRDTGAAIGDMRACLIEIEGAIEAVFEAGSSQQAGVDILNTSIRRVEETAQSNAALAQENNSLMTSLSELDGQLSRALSAFVLSGADAPPQAHVSSTEISTQDWPAAQAG